MSNYLQRWDEKAPEAVALYTKDRETIRSNGEPPPDSVEAEFVHHEVTYDAPLVYGILSVMIDGGGE